MGNEVSKNNKSSSDLQEIQDKINEVLSKVNIPRESNKQPMSQEDIDKISRQVSYGMLQQQNTMQREDQSRTNYGNLPLPLQPHRINNERKEEQLHNIQRLEDQSRTNYDNVPVKTQHPNNKSKEEQEKTQHLNDQRKEEQKPLGNKVQNQNQPKADQDLEQAGDESNQQAKKPKKKKQKNKSEKEQKPNDDKNQKNNADNGQQKDNSSKKQKNKTANQVTISKEQLQEFENYKRILENMQSQQQVYGINRETLQQYENYLRMMTAGYHQPPSPFFMPQPPPMPNRVTTVHTEYLPPPPPPLFLPSLNMASTGAIPKVYSNQRGGRGGRGRGGRSQHQPKQDEPNNVLGFEKTKNVHECEAKISKPDENKTQAQQKRSRSKSRVRGKNKNEESQEQQNDFVGATDYLNSLKKGSQNLTENMKEKLVDSKVNNNLKAKSNESSQKRVNEEKLKKQMNKNVIKETKGPDVEKLKEEYGALDDAEKKSNIPSTWALYEFPVIILEHMLVPLDENGAEYCMTKSLFDDSVKNSELKIVSIKRNENPFLYYQYNERKAALTDIFGTAPREAQFFHGNRNLDSLFEKGFIWKNKFKLRPLDYEHRRFFTTSVESAAMHSSTHTSVVVVKTLQAVPATVDLLTGEGNDKPDKEEINKYMDEYSSYPHYLIEFEGNLVEPVDHKSKRNAGKKSAGK